MKHIQEQQFNAQNTCADSRIDDTIDVQAYDSFEALSNMQQDWDSFMEEMNAEIFLTYDWCNLWWKYYGKGRHLKIFIARSNGRIIGILPVFMENIWIGPFNIRVVKIVSTDFMPTTIIFPVSHDYLSLVIPTFLNRINFFWSWDVLHIGDLSGTYKQLDKLSETLSDTLNGSHDVECKETDVQTYYEIANSFEDQLKTLSARQRTKTKRVYKELQDKGITLKSIAADEQNYMSFLDAFIDMHQAQWQSLGIAGHFVDWPHARELHKDIASAQIKHHRLRILKIMLNDQCIGYEYIYKFGNTYCWFLSARKDLSEFPRIDFHRIAFGEKINHAISDKVKWIDALRGYYEYKLVMGGQLTSIHSVIVHSNKGLSNFRYQLFKRSAYLLDVVYMKIWRRRIVPRLRMRPKPLLNIWIKTHMLSKGIINFSGTLRQITTMNQAITVNCFDSFDACLPHKTEWDNFVLNTGADIFLTFDWCKVWWQHYGKGRDLRLYIFRSNNEIVGIFPMFFEKIWLFFLPIRVGKIVGSDFTLAQFTLPIREEYYDLCLKGLFEDLKKIMWHILQIGPLAGISASTDANLFEKAFRKIAGNNVNIRIIDGMVQTYYKLQTTWEKYLSSLKHSQRKEISHKYNLLERTFPGSISSLETTISDDLNIDSFYKDFVDLHKNHWNSLGHLGHFGDWPDAYKFHQTMAKIQLKHDRLRLIRISLNNEVLGYEYAYKFGNKYYTILNARAQGGSYDKIGLGSIIFSEYAKFAIGEKVTLVDSMRGKYDYKLKLGGKLFTKKIIYITKKSVSNTLRINIFNIISKLLNLFYYRIWFLRLAPKLPFRRSPLWKIWIRTNL